MAELATGFRLRTQEYFEIGITLTPAFYLDYVMTETNVAMAVRGGVAHSEIKSWCAETLTPVWAGVEREVVFRGYYACLSAVSA